MEPKKKKHGLGALYITNMVYYNILVWYTIYIYIYIHIIASTPHGWQKLDSSVLPVNWSKSFMYEFN